MVSTVPQQHQASGLCTSVFISPSTGVLIVMYVASASSVLLRQKILRKCREDIYHFFDRENGQVAIYDAVNPLAAGRRNLAKEFAKHDIQVSYSLWLLIYHEF